MHNFKTNEIVTISAALILISFYSTSSFFPCLSHADTHSLLPYIYRYIYINIKIYKTPHKCMLFTSHREFGRTTTCREAGMNHQQQVSLPLPWIMVMVSLWAHRSQLCSHPSSRMWTPSELQHTTLWDQTDTNQFTATHNLMGSRRHQWIYRSSEQPKDTAEDMGISVLGLVPLWTWIPPKDGLITMIINSHHWELNVMPVLDGHHTALGWLPSLHPPRPMSPSSAPQHSGVPAASHLGLQQRLRTSRGNCS